MASRVGARVGPRSRLPQLHRGGKKLGGLTAAVGFFLDTAEGGRYSSGPMVLRLWLHATVTTLDPACPRAGAIVTAGPQILAVGGEDLAEAWRARVDEVIDLGGRWVIPGITDSHIHFVEHGLAMRAAALEECDSAAEVVDAVVRHSASSSPMGPGDWVIGRGFQVNRWSAAAPPASGAEPPHRALLDAAFPDRPVLLHSRCGHQVWVNTAALRAAQITAATPDPAGGRIVRDAAGEPTGLLQEEAIGLVTRACPPPSEAALRRAVEDATGDLWSHGVVAVHAPESREALAVLSRLHAEQRLQMRVHFLPPVAMAETLIAAGLTLGFGDLWLRLGPLKVFLDGALGSRTALMHEPHEGEPGNCGVEVTPPDQFRAMAEHAHAHGWALAVHAIGDRAVDTAIDVLAESQRRHAHPAAPAADRRSPDPRPWDRIEHFQVFSPGAPQRAARARIAAMMQPVHLFDDWRPADRLWGARARRAYACRSLVEAGVPVCLGSDAPVASANPFLCIHAAVRRTDLAGEPAGGWHPEEALGVAAALEGFCSAPARVAGEEAWRGRIAPGLAADFVVLSADPWSSQTDWRGVHADMTVVDGAVVFDRHRERPHTERPEAAGAPAARGWRRSPQRPLGGSET